MTITREELTDRFLRDLLREQGINPDKALEVAVAFSSAPNLIEVRFGIDQADARLKIMLYALDTVNGRDYGPTPIRIRGDMSDSKACGESESQYFQALGQQTSLSFQSIAVWARHGYAAYVLNTKLAEKDRNLEFYVSSGHQSHDEVKAEK